MRKNDKILRDLCVLAQDVVPVGSARVAAAIVYRRQIVGIGTNIRKSSPFQKRFGRNEDSIWFHAEVLAVKNAIDRIGSTSFLKESTLYIARVKDKNGKPIKGLAAPCDGCRAMINAFGIKKVHYTLECDSA